MYPQSSSKPSLDWMIRAHLQNSSPKTKPHHFLYSCVSISKQPFGCLLDLRHFYKIVTSQFLPSGRAPDNDAVSGIRIYKPQEIYGFCGQIEACNNVATRTNLRLAHYEVIQTKDWINWIGIDWQLCLSRPLEKLRNKKTGLRCENRVEIAMISTFAFVSLPCLVEIMAWPHS